MATTVQRKKPPLIVIVGPTASGKTSLAVQLAKQFDGEIISADSRAIYRDLSIGTAKPTLEERQGVPHWGIDLVEPGKRFTAADFQAYAFSKIAEIRSRGKTPFLVGGTGLYVDAVIYEYDFSAQTLDTTRRDAFMELSIKQLHVYCDKNNVILPENKLNKRYVVNTILRNGSNPKRKHKLDEDTLVVGIATEKEKLYSRIEERATTLFRTGVYEEAIAAGKKYGWDNEAMTGNIYPIVRRYQANELTRSAAIEQFIIADRQLAKRQLTWFRRNHDIKWIALEDAYKYVAHWLSDSNKS